MTRWAQFRVAVVLGSYLILGFLTFGLAFNDRPCGKVRRGYSDMTGGFAEVVETRSCASPIASGIFWPVYWSGVVAIEITKADEN